MKNTGKGKYLSVSVLVPTLNSGLVLEECLKSVSEQDYPKDKIEIIVGDGGSTDETVNIARKYKAKVFPNSLKTGEAGKAVCLLQTQGELAALIDSDNILPSKNWLKTMVEPFSDKDILGSEPWEFTYRKEDTYINRYCALIGMNDPYCYFVGNYDRFSMISGKWTGLKLAQEVKEKYVKVKIEGKTLPTIGANGTIWRTNVLKNAVGKNNYLFDTDIPYVIAKDNPFYFAKVKIGIIHLFCKRLNDFYRKQNRRIKDYLFYEKRGTRVSPWQKQTSFGRIKFILSCVLLFPLFYQSIKGYFRKKDMAWFFHPLACWITLVVYSSGKISSIFRSQPLGRNKWKQ